MINIGLIGLGGISHRVAKGIHFASNARLYAVASRSLDKAIAFQKEHPCDTVYDSYTALMEDEAVDMVYICTPNYLHYEHIQMALRHHLHVVCEKPLVSNMQQLDACFALAQQQHCFLMEAEKTIFTPLNQKLRAMVAQGVIGKLRYIEASYGFALAKEEVGEDFWGFRKQDGGCSYDVGVYPIVYANYFANASIKNCQSMVHMAGEYDDFMQSLIRYENGVLASVRSAWNMDLVNVGYLYGEDGYIYCENFWKNTEAYIVKKGEKETIRVSMASDFTGEIEHAASCIEANMTQSPLLSHQGSREIMRVLQDIKRCCAKEMQE